MDEKKKKIIIAVAVLFIVIIAIVVAVVVTNNNKDKADETTNANQSTTQTVIENTDEYEEIELEIDKNGDVDIADDSKKPQNDSNPQSSGTNNGDSSVIPNANNGDSANGGETSAPAEPTVAAPNKVSSISFGYDANKEHLFLSWDNVGATGYEVSFRNADNSLDTWVSANTTKTKIKYNTKDLITKGVNVEFMIKAYNVDSNGNKAYSDAYVQKYTIDIEDVTVPERNVQVEVQLPKISSKGTLSIYANSKLIETRNIDPDNAVEGAYDRTEIFELGNQVDGIDVFVELKTGSKVVSETKKTISDKLIINLRDNDIEILDPELE